MKSSNFLKLAVANPRGAGIAAAALAVCGAVLAPTGAQAAGYSFQTINDPADMPFMGATFTNLLGINNNGLIAGFYGSGAAGDPNKGFLLTLPNTFTPENFPGSMQTQMTGLNDNGTFVGYFYKTNLGVPFDNQFGFFLKGGKFTEVNNPNTPTSPPSGILIENQLLGVTNNDLAVGFYNSVGHDATGDHAVSHGYTFDIATKTFSANIDDPNASLTNGGTVAAAINNSKDIAGFFTDPSGVIHGFFDDSGVFTTVDPPGATETELLGLNDKGVADGFTIVGGVMHGILYNTLTKTFTVLDPTGSKGTTLNGINDAGDVVGFFVDAAGNTDGTLGTPVPEPSTWIMILAGFAGLGWLGLGRSRRSQAARAAL
jgi:PEP-CTERM motif